MPGLALPALPANKQLFKQSPRRRRRRCRICKRRCPVKYPFTSKRASIATAHHHSSFCTATWTRIGCGVPRARASVHACVVGSLACAHTPRHFARILLMFLWPCTSTTTTTTLRLLCTNLLILNNSAKKHTTTHTHIPK